MISAVIGREAEGDRQQHRDGRDRADAGQHADQRAEQDAHQAVEQVPPLERDAEAEREIVQELQVHRVLLSPGTRARAGRAARGPSRTPARIR